MQVEDAQPKAEYEAIVSYEPSEEDMLLYEQYLELKSLDSDDDDLHLNLRNLPRMNNFNEMLEIISLWLQDLFLKNTRIFYIVCKPYNSNYAANPKLFQKGCFDYLRKYFGFTKNHLYFMTKEVNAAKTHVNILYVQNNLNDETDMFYYENSKTKNYKYSVQEVSSQLDAVRVLTYMIKESHVRRFNLYSDYISSPSVLVVPADK